MTLEEFTNEFEAARPQLKSYILRITASVEDTEDIVQDTFIKASLKLDTFRAESTVKTWIFTIGSNISKDNFKLIDPGNSNNDILSSIESWEKTNLSNKLGLIIDRIEENSENIKTYFPINDEFKGDDENKSSNSKYGLKNGVVPSIPPTNQRFG